MRSTRIFLLLVSATALLALGPFASPAAADAPLRSGTIVGGTGETPVSLWVRGMDGCVGAPTCAAWMQSLCDSRLAGGKVAIHASIVNVGELADAKTERFLKIHPVVGLNWGHFIVQFWTGTRLGSYEFCAEIMGSRLNSWATGGDRAIFRIPEGAQWMTITSSPDNTSIRWTLR
jgi:hypothetical protein